MTLIYSFSKLDIRMSAGYRNIYSTESLGCIAIEVKSGYCIFTGQSIFNILRHDTLRQREKDTLSYHVKTFLNLKKSL